MQRGRNTLGFGPTGENALGTWESQHETYFWSSGNEDSSRIRIAPPRLRCHIPDVPNLSPIVACLLAAPFALASAAEPINHPAIPPDLIDDPHVREELAINEFTAPAIAKVFESLEFLMPLPLADHEREVPARMPLNRADLSIELGFLIADGFLVVQAGEMNKVEGLASQLTRYAKALGAGDKVNRHAAALLESARDGKVEQLKKELSATQRDVELELVALRDADLAHLISLGGWIRALDVAADAVKNQFSEDRAREIMREDIADYYSSIVGYLEPQIAERPSFIEMRDLLAGMRSEMTLGEDEAPTEEMVSEIANQASRLAGLALTREEQ